MNGLLFIIGFQMIMLANCQQPYSDSYWRYQPQQRFYTQAYFSPDRYVRQTIIAEPVNAIAILNGQNATGIVEFRQEGTLNVLITGRISGLKPGPHGFHIHQYGDTREGCKSMGGHFNPDSNHHGAPMDTFRHAGDLGNIEANQNGVAEFNFIDQKIALSGRYSILGRGVVVHANQDDLGRGSSQESRKTGNAGARVACGIVSMANVK